MGASGNASHNSRRGSLLRKRSSDDMLQDQLSGSKDRPIEVPDDGSTPKKKRKTKNTSPNPDEEKRLKRWRKQMPGVWQQRLERALTQRMFVLERTRQVVDDAPQETIELAGSTGNVYHVIIKQIPSCTCPDFERGHECKHIIYVMRLVLKAPADLEYQAAFLVSELQRIFEGSPLPQFGAGRGDSDESNRKPIEGDCPICFMEFEPEKEEIVFCRSACGNNIHKECFEKWARSQNGKEVRCVYCRSMWQGDEPSLERILEAKAKHRRNGEGYINLASELGISKDRDTSTYHTYGSRQWN